MHFTSFSLVGLGLVVFTSPFGHFAFPQDNYIVETPRDSLSPIPAMEMNSKQNISESDLKSIYKDRDYVRYDQSSKATTDSDVTIETNARSEVSDKNVPGDLLGKLQLLQLEIMRLNGLVEQQAYDIRILQERSLERYVELDRRINAVNPHKPDLSKNHQETVFFSDQSSVPEQPGEGEAYRSAYGLVKNKEFELAINVFQNFLRDFPNGKFAPNAHFWLGELYLVLDPADPEAARQAFMLLVTQFSQHMKVPDALYKLGKIQLMKGNRERSKYYLDRVISEYADSNRSVVNLAEDFIDKNNL